MKVKQMTDEFPRRLQYRESPAGYHSETLDTIPLVVPFDCKKPESLEQAIARIMQIKESRQLDEDWESEEEAQDFDCETEDDLRSRYELFEDDDFTEGGSGINAPAAASADDSAQAPEPTPKKRKGAKVTAEPEPASEDEE